jgi:hypothetical protein
MTRLIARAMDALESGGIRRLSGMTQHFIERRWYRAQAAVDGVQARIEVVDVPATAVAACMYRAKIRITNTSRGGVWNDPSQPSPRFAVSAWVTGPGGYELDGPHCVLPAAMKPGDTREVDLVVETPRRPGRYNIAIDIVREGCYWFRDLGLCPWSRTPTSCWRRASRLSMSRWTSPTSAR